MKQKIITILVAISAIMSGSAKDVKGIEILKTNGEVLHFANTALTSMTFSGDDAILTSVSGEILTIARNEIVSVSSLDNIATEYTLCFDGSVATVINPYAFQGVSTDIDGAYVSTINENTTDELTFSLKGATDDGSFTYIGSYKCTLKLDGVDITSR